MLSLARSPKTNKNVELVHSAATGTGGEAFVQGVYQAQLTTTRAEIRLTAAGTAEARYELKKTLLINGVEHTPLEFVGNLKVVLSTAADDLIVRHGKERGIHYLDVLISQTDRNYLKTLQRYNKTFNQRNEVLKLLRANKADRTELDHWDKLLVDEAVPVMTRRMEAVNALNLLAAAPPLNSLPGDELELAYRPGVAARISAELPVDKYRNALRNAMEAELAKKRTVYPSTVGAHRDQVDVRPPQSVRDAAQVRMLAVALKCRAAEYIREATQHSPIMLFDKTLDELTPKQREQLGGFLSEYDQALFNVSGGVDFAMGEVSEVRVQP